MKDALVKVVNFLNNNWAEFVTLVKKVWDFLKDTIFKDDSIWGNDATTGE